MHTIEFLISCSNVILMSLRFFMRILNYCTLQCANRYLRMFSKSSLFPILETTMENLVIVYLILTSKFKMVKWFKFSFRIIVPTCNSYFVLDKKTSKIWLLHTLRSGIVVLVGIFTRIDKCTGWNKGTEGHFYWSV